MSKILSKSGDSLADVYDVAGSIAGIDDLVSKEVHLVHEMGSTILAERLAGQVNSSLATAALLQNVDFSVDITVGITGRLLGLQVISDDQSRVSRAQVSITSPADQDDTDAPIWFWTTAIGAFSLAQVLLSGTVTTVALLIPDGGVLTPNILIGDDSPRPCSTVSLRGRTTGFGAGDVTITALLHFAFPQVTGLSSRGLPLPSW